MLIRVSIVGPDGCGKTSVAKSVSKKLNSSVVLYAGKRKFFLKSTKTAIKIWEAAQAIHPGLGIIAQYFLYYPFEYLENIYRFNKIIKGKEILIYERHPVDRIIMLFEFNRKYSHGWIKPWQYIIEVPLRFFLKYLYVYFFTSIHRIYLLRPGVELIFERSANQYKNLSDVQSRVDAYNDLKKIKKLKQQIKLVDIDYNDTIEKVSEKIAKDILGFYGENKDK